MGLGGVGKTQVALEFAYTVRARWPGYSIFWVPAVSAESFEQSYRDIATECSIVLDPSEKDSKKVVQRYLSSASAGRWLLIVDNCDDEKVLFGIPGEQEGVTDYLPRSENGLTLFTTRHREQAVSLAGSEIVEIQELDQTEAKTFLTKSLAQKDLLSDHMGTIALLQELAFLPLAIAQAAAYLNAMQISIGEYLSLLRSTEQDMVSLLSREFRDDTRYTNSKNAVAATWLISFDQMRRSDPVAADLLSFMSCVENKAIPWSMLPAVEPAERMVHALGTLRAYAFVTQRGDSSSYDMHRLVHLATKVWLEEHGTTSEWNAKVAAHLAKVFPSDNYVNRAVWGEYFPHAFRFLQNTQALGIEARYDLCMAVGMCLQADGRFREAVMWLSECAGWRNERFPDGHRSRLRSQFELACAYHQDGQVKKAITLLEQATTIQKKMFKEDDFDRLASQHELASAYRTDGQVKKAIALFEQVVTIEKKELTEDDPGRLASQHGLAIAYRANGQVKKAINLLEDTIIIKKKVYRKDHFSQLASQHVLAMAYQEDGQKKKAITLLEHVVKTKKKVFREDHPSLLASQYELAFTYKVDGQIKKAITLLEQVIAVQEKVLGEDHPDRLASQDVLLRFYAERKSNGGDEAESDAP